MVPSIIGEDLIITGNVDFQGRDPGRRRDQGRHQLRLSPSRRQVAITGSVIAEDIVVRGRVTGAIRGLRVTLQAQSHVEGDIFHQSLAIEQGAYFEGKSRRSDDPLAELKNVQAAASPRPEPKPASFELSGRPSGRRQLRQRLSPLHPRRGIGQGRLAREWGQPLAIAASSMLWRRRGCAGRARPR